MEGTESAVNSAPAHAASPTTFAEAFASDASPAADPSTQSNDATAAVQPAAGSEAVPQQGDKRSPFIPRERFDEVNRELGTLRDKWKQYEWAEKIDRQALEQAQQIGQLYQQDRAGYIRQLLTEAIADPSLAPAIRSEAARLLGTRQAQAQQTGPDLSQVVIDLGNGQSLPLSALQQQWTQGVLEQIKPFVQSAEQFRQIAELAERQQQAGAFAQGLYGELQSRPHFKQLEPEIKARLAQTRLETDHPAEVKAAALSIYTELLAEKVLPNLSQTAKSELLDNLQQKAAASTSVNPASAAPATARKVTRFDDPSLQW